VHSEYAKALYQWDEGEEELREAAGLIDKKGV
jgi:hypothetical protein